MITYINIKIWSFFGIKLINIIFYYKFYQILLLNYTSLIFF